MILLQIDPHLPLGIQFLLAIGAGVVLQRLVDGYNERKRKKMETKLEEEHDGLTELKAEVKLLRLEVQRYREDYLALNTAVRTTLILIEKTHPEIHEALQGVLDRLHHSSTVHEDA